MTTTIGGSYPAVNSDSDATINGLTVGKGGGAMTENTVVGYQALNATNSGTGRSTAFGYTALNANTTGSYNSAFGYVALAANTTGVENTAVGGRALRLNTGSYNTGVGTYSLDANTSGASNTALGQGSLQSNTTASNNTAVGYQAGYSNTTAVNNVVIGYQAGYTGTTALGNTYVGYQAGYSVATGSTYNTMLGFQAGQNTTSTYNTFVGTQAGQLVTSGGKNTILGLYNGNQGGLDIRTASNYIVLSDGDGNPRGGFDNTGCFYINAFSSNLNGNGNQQLAITSTTRNIGMQTTYSINCNMWANSGSSGTSNAATYLQFFNNSGQQNTGSITSTGTNCLYNNLSDYRLKEDIVPITNGLALVSALKPVNFKWASNQTEDMGFIAHEFQNVIPSFVTGDKDAIDENGKPVYQAMDSSGAIPLLVAAIQELKAEVDSLKQQLGK